MLGAVALVSTFLAGCPNPGPDTRPEASFTAAPRTGNVPLTVTFADTSTVASGSIKSWNWNFGDGVYSSSPNPIHTYNKAGNYTVSLTVTAASGVDTKTIASFVQATERSAFGTIGAAGGAVTASGAGVTVPAGAFVQNTVIGVARDTAAFQPRSSEPITVLSPGFTITRNGAEDRAYAEGDDGGILPSSIEIRFEANGIPLSDLNGDHIHILAQLADGTSLPIVSTIQGDRVRANVLRLPASARYAAVYRPGALSFDVTSPAKADIVTTANWAGGWRVQFSDVLLQQLTALRISSKTNLPALDRRNFGVVEVNQTLAELSSLLTAVHGRLSSSGLRAPVLVNNDGRYGLVLYNFLDAYTTGITDFRDVVYRVDTFGNIVIDSRQLIEIARQNLLDVNADPTLVDLDQKLGVPNAFGQSVVEASIVGYDYPQFETFGTGSEGPVNFLEAVAAGFATRVGQSADGIAFARTFGENEVALLSEALFDPQVVGERGYAVSAQDFYSYFDQRFNLNGTLRPITDSASDPAGLLEEVRREFLSGFVGVPPTAEEALLRGYGAIDRALKEQVGTGLGQTYWLYAKDRGVENSLDARIRPSDAERAPNTVNEALFGEDALVVATMDAPTDTVTIGGDDSPLGEIAPLSSRVVVLELRPQTSELVLNFNRDDWAVDDLGGTVNIKVYKEGASGTELAVNRDTITLRTFEQDEEDCVAKVIVLVSNTNIEEANSVEIEARAFSGLVGTEATVLDDYVGACDADYAWELVASQRIPIAGVTVNQLKLTTSAWRGLGDVDQTKWEHFLTVIEPDNLQNETALLVINGGSTGSNPPTPPAALLPFATQSRGVVALLYAVPNQPLTFDGETSSRSEDEIIAKSYGEYLDSFEARRTDITWPVLLPMARSAVRAMDAVQEFMATAARTRHDVENFYVAGASKRGWTTWLTAAADDRVAGIIPLVIDVLNMDEQMQHHFSAYGFYSSAIQDYVAENVFDRLGTPAGDSLLKIVDPFSYRTRLNMPKFIANSTGDQFFLPDSSQFYLDQLPGQNYLYYAPNTDHGLGGISDVDNTTLKSVLAWYLAQVRDLPLPTYSWTFDSATSTTVTSNVPPSSVKLWQASNTTARDFRLETIGARWTSTTLEEDDGEFTGAVTVPPTGWTAFFVQLTWDGPLDDVDADFSFSTPVRVVPDVYPVATAK